MPNLTISRILTITIMMSLFGLSGAISNELDFSDGHQEIEISPNVKLVATIGRQCGTRSCSGESVTRYNSAIFFADSSGVISDQLLNTRTDSESTHLINYQAASKESPKTGVLTYVAVSSMKTGHKGRFRFFGLKYYVATVVAGKITHKSLVAESSQTYYHPTNYPELREPHNEKEVAQVADSKLAELRSAPKVLSQETPSSPRNPKSAEPQLVEKKWSRPEIPLEAEAIRSRVNSSVPCTSGNCAIEDHKRGNAVSAIYADVLQDGDSTGLSYLSPAERAARAKGSTVSGFSLYQDDNSVYVVRDSDGKRVMVHKGHLREARLYEISPGIIAVEGARRRVSIKHFDFETSFTVSKADMKIEKPGVSGLDETVVDAEKKLADTFPLYEPDTRTENLYLSEDDLGILKKATVAISQKNIKSIVFSGNAGGGKTVLLDEFVRRLPPTWTVFEFTKSNLMAGTGLRGSSEAHIKAIVQTSKVKPVILVTDEIHSLLGAGASMPGEPDVLQELKNGLSRGQIIIAGTTTPTELQMLTMQDEALDRRLNIVEVPILDEQRPEHRDVLTKKLKSYARTSGEISGLSDDLIDDIITKSAILLPYLNEPARSTLVMGKMESMIRLNAEAGNAMSLNQSLVNTAFSQVSKFKLNERELEDFLAAAKQRYRAAIVGEKDAAVEPLFNLTKIAYRGLNVIEGPMVRLLLGGDAGVGKTKRAIEYARAMGLNFLHLTPNNAPDAISKIVDELKKDPFTVIFIDEIEKWPKYAREAMLPLMGDNAISVSRGRKLVKVPTMFSTVIVATNAGEESFALKGHVPTNNEYTAILQNELGRYLVSRFPETHRIRLAPYTRNDNHTILLGVVGEVIKRHSRGLFRSSATIDPSEAEAIVKQVLDENHRQGNLEDLRGLRSRVALKAAELIQQKSTSSVNECKSFYTRH